MEQYDENSVAPPTPPTPSSCTAPPKPLLGAEVDMRSLACFHLQHRVAQRSIKTLEVFFFEPPLSAPGAKYAQSLAGLREDHGCKVLKEARKGCTTCGRIHSFWGFPRNSIMAKYCLTKITGCIGCFTTLLLKFMSIMYRSALKNLYPIVILSSPCS